MGLVDFKKPWTVVQGFFCVLFELQLHAYFRVMEVNKLIEKQDYDYALVYGWFANHSDNEYLIKFLEEEKGMNRRLLKKEVVKLSAHHSPVLMVSDQKRGAIAKSYQVTKSAPREVQELNRDKNACYKLLNERFAMLKSIAYQTVNYTPSGIISLKEALSMMNSRNDRGEATVFRLLYVTNGGEVKEYIGLSLTKLLNKQLSNSIRYLNEQRKTGSSQKWWNSTTRRCTDLQGKRFHTFRINQIVGFNGLEISWI